MNPTQQYVSNRMSSNRDDRSDSKKMSADAALRGKLGVSSANKVIAAIDNLKSHR